MGGVVALVICAIFFLTGMKANATDSKQQQFIGAEKHEIALSEGLELVANFRKNPQAPKSQGSSFDRGALDKILAQPGCEKIKMYWAQEKDGKFTVVLVGVDMAGKDMVAGAIMERGGGCPPFCDVTSPFVMETVASAR
jgi:hypothetical protein